MTWTCDWCSLEVDDEVEAVAVNGDELCPECSDEAVAEDDDLFDGWEPDEYDEED